LPLFNSVQKFICDTLENVVTIFINQALKSPSRQRPFRSFRLFQIFRLRDLSNFHPLLHLIHLPHCILCVDAGFSANRTEKVGWWDIRVIRWLRPAFESGNIQFLLGCPCRVNPCIVHMNHSQGFATFWNLAAFSEPVDSALSTSSQKMANLICYLLGASNSVRCREFPRKR
jgi:hypothetical protein